MMATWFLVIIYLAFISLGIPDSLLGAAWPVMWPELGTAFGSAGIISMVVAGGTIVSSLASGSIIEKIGTGKNYSNELLVDSRRVTRVFFCAFSIVACTVGNSSWARRGSRRRSTQSVCGYSL